MTRILKPGRNCYPLERVDTASVLVDARDYYAAFHSSVLRAERYVLIAGWQFDSRVPLLRGRDADNAAAPVRLLELLEHVTTVRPELRVYLLAWEYSLLFAFEREWMQELKFDWTTNERIQFVFDSQVPLGASHHQKLVIVDGALAFAGGIDLCDERWDDRAHVLDNPERVTVSGAPQKPYHDVMACCTGPAVRALQEVFCERWARATGNPLQLPEAAQTLDAAFSGALPIDGDELAISVTCSELAASNTPRVEQIKTLFEDAIAQAEQSLYVETQYFTSHALHSALDKRMRSGPKLEVVLVTPDHADTAKEAFALGAAQDHILSSLCAVARAQGHELRVMFSAGRDASGKLVATFIHSKVLIVDDRLLSIGSANWTNRSMSMDSELGLTWEADTAEGGLSASICKLRASLLSEHAGIDYDPALERGQGLVERLDARIGHCKLWLREIPERPSQVNEEPVVGRVFDPDKPLTDVEWAEWLELRRS